MTTTTVTCYCGKPTRDNRTICDDCTHWLADTLGSLPRIEAELGLTLAKQRRFDTQTGSTHNTVDGLPYNIAASRALTQLQRYTAQLTMRCGLTHIAHMTTPLMHRIVVLMQHIDTISTQPWAADTITELDRIIEHCMHVIDRPPTRSYAGPCDECGHDLYARNDKPTVECRDCGLEYNLAARRDWLLAHVHDQLATAVEISRALTSLELPVTADRIRQWKTRDRIDVKAHDRLGRPLYRVGDIIELLVETAQRTAS